MANFTQCAFSLPIKITTATQIKITLANSAVGATTKTATAVAGTYFNTVDTTVSNSTTGLLGHLLYQLGQAEAGVISPPNISILVTLSAALPCAR